MRSFFNWFVYIYLLVWVYNVVLFYRNYSSISEHLIQFNQEGAVDEYIIFKLISSNDLITMNINGSTLLTCWYIW